MPKYYDTYDALFKRMEEDIGEALMNVSNQLIEIWKELVQINFYDRFEPQVYSRSYQSLDAISLLTINKSANGYEITMGYDESKINTYEATSNGYTYTAHENPELQGGYLESGFVMNNGVRREGAHALEEMLKYVNSRDFKALFENECRKLGYGVTFK